MRGNKLFLVVGLIVLGSVLFAGSLDNTFHYDDRDYIVYNEEIQHLENLPRIFTGIRNPKADPKIKGHYRPLVLSSYLLNHAAGGIDPRGYYLVNLSLHLLMSVLVVLVMERLTGRLLVGGLAGLLFLIHPFNAEAVNYVTARSSQFYALFSLMAFYGYLRYRPPAIPGGVETAERGSRRYLWLGISLFSFTLAILSKEMAVAFPLIILLYEALLVREGKGWRGNRHLWGAILLMSGLAASYLAIRKVLVGGIVRWNWEDLPGQFATQSVILVKTLGLILWPAGLTIDHRVETYPAFFVWPAAGALFFLAGIFGLILWWGRSREVGARVRGFLLAWFFVALSPLAVVQLNSILQENRSYLAVVGILGLAAIGLGAILDRAGDRSQGFRRSAWVGIVLLMLVFGGVTLQRNAVWQDEVSLWQDAVKKNPYSFRGRANLGAAYEREGKLDAALEQYRQSWILRPGDPMTVYNMGAILEKSGRESEAAPWFKIAYRLNPGFYGALVELGKKRQGEGEWDKAVSAYKRAVMLFPEGVEGRLRLADSLARTGRTDEAILELQRVLRIESISPEFKAKIQTEIRKLDRISDSHGNPSQ